LRTEVRQKVHLKVRYKPHREVGSECGGKSVNKLGCTFGSKFVSEGYGKFYLEFRGQPVMVVWRNERARECSRQTLSG